MDRFKYDDEKNNKRSMNQRAILGVKRRPGGGIIMFKRKLNLKNNVLRICKYVIVRKIG